MDAIGHHIIESKCKAVAISLIQMERQRQNDKFPNDRNIDPRVWLNVLIEEVGETAKEIMEHNDELMQEELIQVAAVAQAWIEDILIQREKA